MAQIEQFPIETTPLATVTVDTTADAVLIVKDGVVKKVALDVSGGLPVAALTFAVIATW